MKLAKPCIDIGLATNNLDPMLEFWQCEVGLPLDHVLKVRRGQNQHRHDAMGSVFKLNHLEKTLPDTPPSGYLELLVAKDGLEDSKHLTDPDGNKVALVPTGAHGVEQIGVRLGVRDLDAHKAFYKDAFGFEEIPYNKGVGFKAANSVILLEQDPAAPSDAVMDGKGWRYITLQVFKVDNDHAHVLSVGGREAMPPTTLGTTARISMVRDPDGNWIELSQRASIVGSLD